MPFVQVHTIEGIMSAEQRSQLIDRITEVMVEVELRGMEQFRSDVWVQVSEHPPESWSLGGRRPTRAQIEALFDAAPPA